MLTFPYTVGFIPSVTFDDSVYYAKELEPAIVCDDIIRVGNVTTHEQLIGVSHCASV
jgi:hypothetical protein